MSVTVQDICVSCSKTIKQCHKDITCKKCKMYVHKKCTKLKPRELKRINRIEWVCSKCTDNDSEIDDSEIVELTDYNVSHIDLEKYDNMMFNPLRFESTLKNEINDNYQFNECSYVTPEQLKTSLNVSTANLLY